MKLNPDCIRDILLDVEENTDLLNPASYDLNAQLSERLSAYSPEELGYHIVQCHLNGYFADFRSYSDTDYEISYLSPLGHKFLADIRSDSIWNQTKHVAGKIGVWSLDAIGNIASGIITEIIQRQFTN